MAFVTVVGTLTFVSENLINPYTGETITLNGNYYVNDAYVDGGPGSEDILAGDPLDQFYRLEDELGTLLIENFEIVFTGSGNDIVNLASTNYVLGDMHIATSEGNDIVWANAGNDRIEGGIGHDILNGGPGNDEIFGQGDNDVLIGGAGADLLDGGSGIDTADYSASSSAVHLDMQYNNIYGGDAQGDTLVGIENLVGSNNASQRDFLFGDENDNALFGMAGKDFLQGGAGADVVDGGNGWDYAMYTRSDAAVQINLETNVNTGGHAEGDILQNIEAIIASEHNDTLEGDASNNYFRGEAGDDILIGKEGRDILLGGAGNDALYGGEWGDVLIGGAGADLLDGGSGIDTADYSGSSSAVHIDMQYNNIYGGDAQGDTFHLIENVIGSDLVKHRDYLFGNDFGNELYGMAGKDFLQGGAGADLIDGGGGWDYAMYTRSDAAVQINFGTNVNTGGHAEGDILQNIEAIIASDHNDTLEGDSNKNYFRGEAGDDILKGHGGRDTLFGGAGDDALYGGSGSDALTGGAGADDLYGGEGADTFKFVGDLDSANMDSIRDFNINEGDRIDISDLLSGYDPLSDAISDFVSLTEVTGQDGGTHTVLAVDSGSGIDTAVATIHDVTGLNLENLETSGVLITV